MNLIIGIFVGFLITEIISSRKSRKQLIKSLRFQSKHGIIHIHHWTWCLVLLIFLLYFGYENLFILGLLFGGFIQGLTYEDSFKFIYE